MEERLQRSDVRSRLWIFAGVVVTAFVVTLGVLIGKRLSDEALAVLAGAVCGVGAAIPTSLIVVAVSRWRDEQRAPQQPLAMPWVYPPVVVVAPPNVQPQPADWNRLPQPPNAPVQRQFTVVGGGQMDTEVTYGRYS